MYFTQEDYQKIQSWLIKNSIKDSDLPLASSLTGNEMLTLLLSGKNTKTTLDTFSALFSAYLDSYAREDFFNVTKYLYNTKGSVEESIVNLDSAIEVCPSELQRSGLVITFISTTGNWEVWRFTGTSTSEWTDTSEKWQCLEGKSNLGVTMTANVATINAGSTSDVTITFATNDGGKASTINLYVNDTLTETWTNTASVSYTLEAVGTDTTVKIVANVYGIEFTLTKTVNIVYPCFIGASSDTINLADVAANPTYLQIGTLDGKYTITTTAAKPYFYLVMPEAMVIQNYALNGIDISYEISQITQQGLTYNIFKSTTAFDAGSYEVTVGSYTEDNSEIIKNLLYRVNTLEEAVKTLLENE